MCLLHEVQKFSKIICQISGKYKCLTGMVTYISVNFLMNMLVRRYESEEAFKAEKTLRPLLYLRTV